MLQNIVHEPPPFMPPKYDAASCWRIGQISYYSTALFNIPKIDDFIFNTPAILNYSADAWCGLPHWPRSDIELLLLCELEREALFALLRTMSQNSFHWTSSFWSSCHGSSHFQQFAERTICGLMIGERKRLSTPFCLTE